MLKAMQPREPLILADDLCEYSSGQIISSIPDYSDTEDNNNQGPPSSSRKKLAS